MLGLFAELELAVLSLMLSTTQMAASSGKDTYYRNHQC